jgi:hypothetical protein
MMVRSPGLILEPLILAFLITANPFVKGLATDPATPRHLGYRIVSAEILADHYCSFVLHTGFFP